MNIYEQALFAQSAPNLAALVKSLHEIIEEIKKEPGYDGTDYINKHPVTVMFVAQFLHLSTRTAMNMDVHHAAYMICEAKAKENS